MPLRLRRALLTGPFPVHDERHLQLTVSTNGDNDWRQATSGDKSVVENWWPWGGETQETEIVLQPILCAERFVILRTYGIIRCQQFRFPDNQTK